jgi:lysophospholipase L1-like esterase
MSTLTNRLLFILLAAFTLVSASAQPRVLPLTAGRTAAEASGVTAYRANPLTLRVKLDATRPTATGLESITAEIRASLTDTEDPLASVTLSTPTGAGPFDLMFSGAQLNQDLAGKPSRQLWLVIYSLDDAGETLDVWHSGKLTLLEHGASLTAPAPPNVVGVLTRPAGDSRYASLSTGREYLGAWYNKVISGAAPKIVLAGDSTMVGTGISNPAFLPQNLLKESIGQTFPITIFNDAVSGSTAADWLADALPNQIARTPDLIIVSFGINDGATNRDGFEADLRAGLALIRASLPLDQTSILLESPSATNDTPNGRDAAWYEIAVPVIRRAAADFQCCFLDKYHLFPDAASGAAWYDDPYGDGRHIHPKEALALQINEERLRLICQKDSAAPLFPSAITNISGLDVLPNAVSNGPGDYSKWFSQWRAVPASLWPLDGSAITFKHRDGVWFQLTTQYQGSSRIVWRTGSTSGWNAWDYPLTTMHSNGSAAGALSIEERTSDPNGAELDLWLNRGNGSVDDRLGEIHFYGNNAAGTKTQQAALYAEAAAVGAGAESGRFLANVTSNGALAPWLSVDGATKVIDFGQGFGDPVGFSYRLQTRGPLGTGEPHTLSIDGATGQVGIGMAGVIGNRLTVAGRTELCRGGNFSFRFDHDSTNASLQAYAGGTFGPIFLNAQGGAVYLGSATSLVTLNGPTTLLAAGTGKDIRAVHDGTTAAFQAYTGGAAAPLTLNPDGGTVKTPQDIEVTDSAKGIILNRVQVANGGTLTTTAL